MFVNGHLINSMLNTNPSVEAVITATLFIKRSVRYTRDILMTINK